MTELSCYLGFLWMTRNYPGWLGIIKLSRISWMTILVILLSGFLWMTKLSCYLGFLWMSRNYPGWLRIILLSWISSEYYELFCYLGFLGWLGISFYLQLQWMAKSQLSCYHRYLGIILISQISSMTKNNLMIAVLDTVE